MIKRVLLNGLLTTVIQIVLYIILLYCGWTIGSLFHKPSQMTIEELVSFGLIVELSVILFGAMVLTTNIIAALVNNRFLTWGLLFISATLCIIVWGEDFNSWPWKTVLYLGVGLGTIFLKFYLDRQINRLAKN